MGTQSNFRTAVNELMAGKLTTDTESVDAPHTREEDSKKTSQPVSPMVERTESANRSGVYSVIAEDMVIEGSIYGDSSIQINGRIKGNVTSTKDIISKGVVEGDIKAANITLSHSSVKGNINATGFLNVDGDSVVVGNVDAGSLEISGRVKGDIKAEDMALLKKAALVLGNVTSKSVAIEAGAGLKGRLEILSVPIHDKDFKLQGFTEAGERIKKDNEVMESPAVAVKADREPDPAKTDREPDPAKTDR